MGQALEMCVHCENKRGCDTCTDLNNWIMEHLEPKQEWISVKDRLPEENDYVPVLVTGVYMGITFRDATLIAEYYKNEGWLLERFPDWENPSVTHWMPLPEPPKEGE